MAGINGVLTLASLHLPCRKMSNLECMVRDYTQGSTLSPFQLDILAATNLFRQSESTMESLYSHKQCLSG